jgi:ferredoxin-type protein NapG
MKRRDLFRLGARKAAQIAYRVAGGKTAWRAESWLRPPFAKEEPAFLLACTRCDKCIEACPHDVLFKLPERLGRRVAGTPAMDLLNRGCRMCGDWPCVEACEPQALLIPNPPVARARLARARIDPNTCLPYLGPECGACADACPVPGALEWEDGLRPVINEDSCTGCALCREACIVDPKAIEISAFVADGEAATA